MSQKIRFYALFLFCPTLPVTISIGKAYCQYYDTKPADIVSKLVYLKRHFNIEDPVVERILTGEFLEKLSSSRGWTEKNKWPLNQSGEPKAIKTIFCHIYTNLYSAIFLLAG
ncbi:MAG: hypothetical protein V3T17_01010 [Pseudomonadales bacterium]